MYVCMCVLFFFFVVCKIAFVIFVLFLLVFDLGRKPALKAHTRAHTQTHSTHTDTHTET